MNRPSAGMTAVLLVLAAVIAAAPFAFAQTNLAEREQQIVAAALANRAGKPQFNGAAIFGVQPGKPVIQIVAVSGAAPISFSAKNLPAGLKLDQQNGIITGALSHPGHYQFTIIAQNRVGSRRKSITMICGDTIALTPPMGWNSYDAFGDSVTEAETLANAAWLKEHLTPFGWDTVVVDFRWYDSKADGVRVQNPEGVTLDKFGRCIPAPNRFPSAAAGLGFKPLADKIHAMGLKFGIHIMRGIPRRAVEQDLPICGTQFRASQAVRPVGDDARECKWNRDMFGVAATTEAGQAWYASIARQYAEWGVDYIKCDDIANLQHGANRYPRAEVAALADGLRASGRAIVLSLSPGPALIEESAHLRQYANLWRISGDFWDNWRALNHNFDLFANWQTNGAPGHWPDGDMIPFGHICLRNCDVHPDRWTHFTRDEQLTLMSLWSLAPSPLMLGMNLPDNDDWTTALLTNPEVLAVNQDSLGQPARKISVPGVKAEVWRRELADGAHAIGLFNRTDTAVAAQLNWEQMGFSAKPKVRDLWLRQDLKKSTDYHVEIPPHGCVLLKVAAD